MPIALLLPNYLIWHYSKGLRELLVNWGHVLYFVIHYFSIPNLLLTLFYPWKRMDEGAKHTINPGVILEHIIFNTLMRLVGLLVRSVTIIIGLMATALTIFGGLVLVLFWFLMPALLMALILGGVTLIVRPMA